MSMPTSESSASIVRAIIDLAHAMGLQCIAEGVETREMLGFLRNSGCDCAQGFHVARPMPAAEIPAHL
jgi:EAL domain-containing protein (putative c-di-GMP-specific phosphodiesterase class I)